MIQIYGEMFVFLSDQIFFRAGVIVHTPKYFNIDMKVDTKVRLVPLSVGPNCWSVLIFK